MKGALVVQFLLMTTNSFAEVNVSTLLRSRTHIFGHYESEKHDDVLGLSDAFVTLEYQKQDFGLKLTPWLRAVHQHKSEWIADFPEAWAEYVQASFDLRVGFQQLQWGSGDELSPVNVWRALDLQDPLLYSPRSNLAIKLQWHPQSLDQLIIEAVYTPHFTPHRFPLGYTLNKEFTENLPTQNSRYFSFLPNTATGSGVSVPILYQISGSDVPNPWEAGLRTRLVGLGDFDIALSYAYFIDKSPLFNFDIAGSVITPGFPLIVTINGVHPRRQLLGLDGSIVFEKFVVRYELAHITTSDTASLKNIKDSLSGAIYLDHEINWRPFDFSLSTSLGLGKNSGSNDEVASAIPDIIDTNTNFNAFPNISDFGDIFIIKLMAHKNRWLISTRLYIDQNDTSGLSIIDLKYSWTDELSLGLSNNLFFGDTTSNFGSFKAASSSALTLTWSM